MSWFSVAYEIGELVEVLDEGGSGKSPFSRENSPHPYREALSNPQASGLKSRGAPGVPEEVPNGCCL